MDSTLTTNKIIEQTIEKETIESIENEYWKHVEYAENINTLIYCGRAISVSIVVVIAIILIVNKIKNKKINKILLSFFLLFVLMTIVVFLIKIMPV